MKTRIGERSLWGKRKKPNPIGGKGLKRWKKKYRNSLGLAKTRKPDDRSQLSRTKSTKKRTRTIHRTPSQTTKSLYYKPLKPTPTTRMNYVKSENMQTYGSTKR